MNIDETRELIKELDANSTKIQKLIEKKELILYVLEPRKSINFPTKNEIL